MKNKILKTLTGIVLGTLMFGMSVFAAEFTVTPTNTVLFTTTGADLLADADSKAQVVVLDMQAGLPFQVTGVTSNGYFQVKLNGQTYYIEGAGLTQNVSGTPTTATTTTASTTVTRNANGTVPVKDANGNYVCLIESNDNEQFYACTGNKTLNRQDYTKDPMYIYYRDEIEKQIVAGKSEIRVNWRGIWGNRGSITENVVLDVYKSHPEYCDNMAGVTDIYADAPGGLEVGNTNIVEATHYIIMQKSDISRGQMLDNRPSASTLGSTWK